jgi:putative transposase
MKSPPGHWPHWLNYSFATVARLPRLAIGGQPHVLVQRGKPGQALFLDDADRQLYLDTLQLTAQAHQVAVHAYVLLNDHIGLLATPLKTAEDLGRCMQLVGRRYVPTFHKKHGTTGALWAGRFQSAVFEAPLHLMNAMRFIEQAPVRAGAITQAVDWPWSSARHHTGQGLSPCVAEQSSYWQWGNTPFEREAKHAQVLQQLLSADELKQWLSALSGGWPLGSTNFVEAIAQQHASRRAARPARRGRPCA